jgi:hypothetical protein
MSTIIVGFKDSAPETFHMAKGGGPIGESWFGVHTHDETQAIFNKDNIVSVHIAPDMGDKMGLNDGKG